MDKETIIVSLGTWGFTAKAIAAKLDDGTSLSTIYRVLKWHSVKTWDYRRAENMAGHAWREWLSKDQRIVDLPKALERLSKLVRGKSR